jgi:hypothetical protein
MAPNWSALSVLTTGDAALNGYRMVGVPDGMGAFDNNDGTFTLLVNQELGQTNGIVRAHGSTGAFVSSWVIDKSTWRVLSGTDFLSSANNLYLWNATSSTPWFEKALQTASQSHFGAAVGYIGQGGTIPLMNMLSQGFPTAQMMVCGVLGPKSNAHGPNEFLHVPYAKKLTASVAEVMASLP